MTDAHREIERKLRVDALFRLPPLTELEGVQSVEAQPTVTLHNHYFDTPTCGSFGGGSRSAVVKEAATRVGT